MRIDFAAQEPVRWMSRVDHLVFLAIEKISAMKSKRTANGVGYCEAGQQWIAKEVGCSVRTVQRSVKRLCLQGVIFVQHRRTRWGKWRTNLCALARRFAWKIKAAASKVRSSVYRPPNLADKLPQREGVLSSPPPPSPPKGGEVALRALIEQSAERDRLRNAGK